MNRTGKRRKRRVKKYLTLLIAVLILAIAGTIGLGIWKKSNRKEQIQTPASAQTEKKRLQVPWSMKEKNMSTMTI